MAHCSTSSSPVCFYRDVNDWWSGSDRWHIESCLAALTLQCEAKCLPLCFLAGCSTQCISLWLYILFWYSYCLFWSCQVVFGYKLHKNKIKRTTVIFYFEEYKTSFTTLRLYAWIFFFQNVYKIYHSKPDLWLLGYEMLKLFPQSILDILCSHEWDGRTYKMKI